MLNQCAFCARFKFKLNGVISDVQFKRSFILFNKRTQYAVAALLSVYQDCDQDDYTLYYQLPKRAYSQ